MRNLPANLVLEKNKLDSQEPWLVLLDVTMPNGDKYYLIRNNEDVIWNNINYSAVPFNLDIYKVDDKGAVPELRLTVPNENRIFQGYLEAYDGCIDADVVIRVISYANLMEDYSELELNFSVQGSQADSEYITFTLGPVNPLRQRFPAHRYLANHCSWQFQSVECAYAGTDTYCNRTLLACRNKSNEARFGGYPGLDKIGVKLV